MKKRSKAGKGVTKGAPSGLMASVLIHAGAFLLAGMLVVFTVQKKDEVTFEPPEPVERPKMKLKKPKVRVKKSAKPKSSSRIVTKVTRANMPDIKLPEMSGMSDGLIGGLGGGGFGLMPDLDEMATPFGGSVTTGNELKGYFYNFNRNRRGGLVAMSPDAQLELFYEFMSGGWKSSTFSRHFRSPEPLYTPTICVPTQMSEIAPSAFGMEGQEGYCWGVLYEGTIVYPEDITFRFWGVGDKVLAVNVDGETVLICAYRADDRYLFGSIWQTADPKDNVYYFGEHRARPSDWITLKAGEPQDIKVLLGDTNGGLVYHILSVEVEGEEYPWDRGGGGPTFPVFKTTVIPQDLQDVIYSNLYPGDASLTNGPVFNDLARIEKSTTPPAKSAEDEAEDEKSKEADYKAMRVWTMVDGKQLEGTFRSVVGEAVILGNAKRKQVKLSYDQLSDEDKEYIEFATPPQLDLNFYKKSEQVPNPPTSPWVGANQRPLQIFDLSFGARVKQTSVGDYNRELTVEYFAIGKEVDGDNYVLLERGKSPFTLTKENKRTFAFYSDKKVRILRIAYRDSAPVRGTKYQGNLVVVRDERGKIIAHSTSNDFLYDNLENLSKLRRNNHFDRECKRTIPAQPTEDSRGPGAVNGN